jgi:hypothetical protein
MKKEKGASVQFTCAKLMQKSVLQKTKKKNRKFLPLFSYQALPLGFEPRTL